MNSVDLINLAKEHAGKATMMSSCLLCIKDAEHHQKNGNLAFAELWAIRSLKYSLGVLDPLYIRLEKRAFKDIGFHL